jgi:RimJ/RimL family protein N-acetyltransferase
MSGQLVLRDVRKEDLPVFFQNQLDEDASYMAAFTSKDPADQEAFSAHWDKILADPTVTIQTILYDGCNAGHVLSYEDEGKPEVSYWIGKAYWGKGIATQALREFLAHKNEIRPIYARVARDNVASRKVLQKCGFTTIGESRGYANARGEEIDELLMELGED